MRLLPPCKEIPSAGLTEVAKLECFIGAIRTIVDEVVHESCQNREGSGGNTISPSSSRVGQDTGTTPLEDSPPGGTATVLAHPVAFRRPLTVCADMDNCLHASSDGDTGHRRTPDSHNNSTSNTSTDILRAPPPPAALYRRSRTKFASSQCYRPCCQSYPTDAKEREKERKKKLKETGETPEVRKRLKIVEDHYDDCGDDLTSIQEMLVDVDDEFTDLHLEACMLSEFPHLQYSYPIDPSKVARPQPGLPVPGHDPVACRPKDTKLSRLQVLACSQ